jgi:hypothetical protein
MGTSRFEQLAATLADRDRHLPEALVGVQEALGGLRERAREAVDAFVRTAAQRGSPHLTDVVVGPVEPDEKHVDCLQFKVRRGRWELTCVGKSRGVVVLVGPYRRGKPEQPCAEHSLPGAAADAALDDRLLALLREASAL